MADLPKQRLAVSERPFMYIGCDYFGPMIVKLSKQTRSNPKTSERYGVLCTCLTVRALHLELADDLPTHSFIFHLRTEMYSCCT